MTTATATAHPNIAFIKYWGNRDDALRLPANGSISMNLGALFTRTSVEFNSSYSTDQLILDGKPADLAGQNRTSHFLDAVRRLAGRKEYACVESTNNFPAGAGIASSASAYAAMALAAVTALELNLSEKDLSRLARLGSGSACRSIPAGFVEWLPGQSDTDSYAVSIAPPEHWDLVDCVAVVSREHKPVGSTEGHRLAGTSPLQQARLEDAPRRLDLCRQAILQRDFSALAEIAELDSNLMHAVMSTSQPRLLYYESATISIMKSVTAWRQAGTPVFYTIDAGPNVHVITLASESQQVVERISSLPGVEKVLVSPPGSAAHFD